MKLTRTGYRISKNGKINLAIEKDAIIKGKDCGISIKVDGSYYFFDRKQGSDFIYLL